MFEMMPFRRPFNSIKKHGDYFDNFFDSFFNYPLSVAADLTGRPFKVDVQETQDAFIIEADLPGVKKEAIAVEFDNDYLTITARKEDVREEEKQNYLRRERYSGEFKRSFYINNINKAEIEAAFNDGVLKIKLPKQNQEPEKKTIDIK